MFTSSLKFNATKGAQTESKPNYYSNENKNIRILLKIIFKKKIYNKLINITLPIY